ncbi:MAG: MarR family transcriptional regulator [Deltaproteobacteria bacterium]|nr:MAG: MarR family transcriptional regulator [Deltaproteobacteria bacterium]
MSPPQEPLGLLIAAARRGLKMAVLRHARHLQLTPGQFWFLYAARDLPGATLGELARRQRLDAPTASRVAVALEERGYLRVQPDPDDRRALRIALTAPGAKLVERIEPIATAVRAASVQGMSQREQEMLRALLRKLIGNLEAFAEEAPAHRVTG